MEFVIKRVAESSIGKEFVEVLIVTVVVAVRIHHDDGIKTKLPVV